MFHWLIHRRRSLILPNLSTLCRFDPGNFLVPTGFFEIPKGRTLNSKIDHGHVQNWTVPLLYLYCTIALVVSKINNRNYTYSRLLLIQG